MRPGKYKRAECKPNERYYLQMKKGKMQDYKRQHTASEQREFIDWLFLNRYLSRLKGYYNPSKEPVYREAIDMMLC